MNILKKKSLLPLLAASLLPFFAGSAFGGVYVERPSGVPVNASLTRELEAMERSVRELFSRSRKRESKVVTVRFSGAVPPREIRLVCNRRNPIIEFDAAAADVQNDPRFRRLLYAAFYMLHFTGERGEIRVRPVLPWWITDAMDLQRRLDGGTRLLKGNYDLPVLRAYLEWGHLPPPEVVIPPAAAPETAAERRCRAEYGFLLLAALRESPQELQRYVEKSTHTRPEMQKELFLTMLMPPLVKRSEKALPPAAIREKKKPEALVGLYLLKLAGKLAWTPAGNRPAANVLDALHEKIARVTLSDVHGVRQSCNLASLPRFLPTLPLEMQQKIRASLAESVVTSMNGCSRPLALAGRAFLRALERLPMERKEGDEEEFQKVEKAFVCAAGDLFEAARREAAIDLVVERVMAEKCNLPFKKDGIPWEFSAGEPLNRSVERLLDQAEKNYL